MPSASEWVRKRAAVRTKRRSAHPSQVELRLALFLDLPSLADFARPIQAERGILEKSPRLGSRDIPLHEFDLAQGRHAVPGVEGSNRYASKRDVRRNGGGRNVKLKIAMADAKGTAPSIRSDEPDDAEARRGYHRGTRRGWRVSVPSGLRQMPLLPPRRGVPALADN